MLIQLCFAQNYRSGDGYHAQITHASSLGLVVDGFPLPPNGHQFGSRLGHGHSWRATPPSREQNRFDSDLLHDYQTRRRLEAADRLGLDRANGPMSGHFTVFPNFSGLSGAANIRVWHPKGPNKFEIWSWTVVDRDAPPEVKERQRLGALRNEGEAGIVETDDGENWNLIGQLLEQGYQVRQVGWNYQMGLGHEHDDDPVFPGRIGEGNLGEVPHRAFYRRWLEFLTSEKWPHVDAMNMGGLDQE